MSKNNMQCLASLVGLRGLCEEDDTHLFVNDLPGIQFKSFSEVATQEDVTGRVTFERLRREATLSVFSDVLNALEDRKNLDLLDIVSSYESGAFSKDQYYGAQELLIGKEIYTNSGGQMIRQRLDWIEIKTKTSAVKPIYIEADGVTYHKQKVILEPGINRIPIGLTGDLIKVYFSICDLELAHQYSDDCGCYQNNCSCSKSGCGYERTIESTDGAIWSSASINPFRIHVSCVCDRASIICEYKESLAQSIRYKIGLTLMEEIIYSSGKSFFIRNSKENAEKWIASVLGEEDPETGFKQKSKYWQSIGQAVNTIARGIKKTPCVECKGLKVSDSIP